MIVVVRINRCRLNGGSVAGCAYRAWSLGRLLGAAAFRDQFKYLIALNGGMVEGIFCIHSVALDPIPARQRKVQFGLTPVNENCFNALENLINDLYIPCSLNRLQGSRYITLADIAAAGFDFPNIDCCNNGINLVEAWEIQQIERPQGM